MFSFFLSDDQSGSELYLGGVNEAKVQRPISWSPVTQKAYWQIGGGSVLINGQRTVSNQQVIVDTGTTLIYAVRCHCTAICSQAHTRFQPNSTVAQIFKPIQGAKYWQDGYWIFPCSNNPSVSWSFSNSPAFTMSSDSFNLGRTYGGSPYCVAAIVAQSFAGSTILLGDAFLKVSVLRLPTESTLTVCVERIHELFLRKRHRWLRQSGRSPAYSGTHSPEADHCQLFFYSRI